jgi:DNA-binding SARP family transcriptional activator
MTVLEFAILGPVEVTAGGQRLDIGGPRTRAVLARLVVVANSVVAAETIADELWPELEPGRAMANLQVRVAQVRRAFRQAGAAGRLVTRAGGYVLLAGPDEVDAARFDQLAAEGRALLAAGDAAAAAGRLERALKLWHGPPLADVGDWPWAQAEAGRLREARLAAVQCRIQARMDCGAAGEVIAELEALTAGHPLRERLWALRMLALYRCGRQAEALAVYQQLRATLAEELGIEPTMELRDLHQQVLTQDPALAVVLPAAVAAAGAAGLDLLLPSPAGGEKGGADSAGLLVELLGPVGVRVDGFPVPIPQLGLRALLACLALSVNQIVSSEALFDALWGNAAGRPDERTLNTRLQARVYQLRKLFSGLEPEGRYGQRIVTRPPGYGLLLSDRELDISTFAAMARRGRDQARSGSVAAAAESLRCALQLWRGSALADVAAVSERLGNAAIGLEEQRSAVLEDRVQADLDSGNHDAVAAEAALLTAAHPLRERLRSQVMLSQYRAGRQADALHTYRQGRALLSEELGIDPGPEIRDLQQRILTSDPELLFRAAPGDRASAGIRVPTATDSRLMVRQLPPGLRHFSGRGDELARLDGLADQASPSPGNVTVVAVTGPGGIGKTSLALEWAHRAASKFPDGQFYVNLRGYDPSETPLPPSEAVRGFLEALGVPSAHIPETADARTAMYRSLTAGRRVLIIADNARNADHVRPLLPASAGSMVIATSRSALLGLAAANCAEQIRVGLLSGEEARDLLRSRLGADRLAAEPEAISLLIRLCGRLPLALAISAARAAAQPERSLDSLIVSLAAEPGRLDALDTGDLGVSVRAVFSWSYGQLTEAAARLFRLLGLHRGPDISTAAAASLAGVSRAEALRQLSELACASMIAEDKPGRFALHDLMRGYAAEVAATTETAAAQRAAIGRGLDHYLHSAYRGARLLSMLAITVGDPGPGVIPEDIGDYTAAIPWFEAEHEVLLGCVRQAERLGFDRHAWQIPWTMVYLAGQGHVQDLIAVNRAGLTAAQRLGDHTALGWSEYGYGWAEHRAGEDHVAVSHLRRAIGHFAQVADPIGAGTSLEALSMTLGSLGDHAGALDAAEQALARFRAAHELSGQAYSLGLAGRLQVELGEGDAGRKRLELALQLYEELADPIGLTDVLTALGEACSQLALYDPAVAYLSRATAAAHQMNDDLRVAQALTGLSKAHSEAGNSCAAQDARQRALEILDRIQHPDTSPLRARLRPP